MKKIQWVLSVFALISSTSVFGQAGTLDGDFDADGKVLSSVTGLQNNSVCSRVQKDGKIITAGSVYLGSTSGFHLIRYNSDGSLDKSFNTTGSLYGEFGIGYSSVTRFEIQSDGKLLIAGSLYDAMTATSYVGLARYNGDGTVDNSFSVDGHLTTLVGDKENGVYGLCLQSDNRILVTGSSKNASDTFSSFMVLRYNADGTLDNNFDGDGKKIFTYNSIYGQAAAVTTQSDGKILVAGTSIRDYPNNDFMLARMKSDGSFDTDFSVDGLLNTVFKSSDQAANSIAVRSDGKIIVGGTAKVNGRYSMAIAVYNTDGTLDLNFSGDGKLTVGFDSTTFQSDMILQPDGKILIGGSTFININKYDFVMARINSDGLPDNTFGANGFVFTQVGNQLDDYCRSITLQPDGKIIAAGITADVMNVSTLVTARYLSGLNLGLISFNTTNSNAMVYPNPITANATLKYELANAECITITLQDMQGKNIKIFTENEKQTAGEHSLGLAFPESLPSGAYLIQLSTSQGAVTIKVMK